MGRIYIRCVVGICFIYRRLIVIYIVIEFNCVFKFNIYNLIYKIYYRIYRNKICFSIMRYYFYGILFNIL